MTDDNPDYYIKNNLSEENFKLNFIKGFDCGLPMMNKFYKDSLNRAIRAENFRAIGAIGADASLIGFCTLSLAAIERAKLKPALVESNLPNQLSVVRLIMLAVEKAHQGKGIAKEMLRVAFKQAAQVHEQIPIKGIYLDSAPGSVSFYEELGFFKLSEADENNSTPMLLRIDTVLMVLAQTA